MYLLGVLSSDKSREMTSVRQLYNTYDALLSHSAVHPDIQAAITAEANRIWRNRVSKPALRSVRPERSVNAASGYDSLGERRCSKQQMRVPPVEPMNLEFALGTAHQKFQTRNRIKTEKNCKLQSHSLDDALDVSQNAEESAKEVGATGVRPTAKDSLLSPADVAHESLRHAFVKRLLNVVSVWVAERSQQHLEFLQLRRRLKAETRRRDGAKAANTSDIHPLSTSLPKPSVSISNSSDTKHLSQDHAKGMTASIPESLTFSGLAPSISASSSYASLMDTGTAASLDADLSIHRTSGDSITENPLSPADHSMSEIVSTAAEFTSEEEDVEVSGSKQPAFDPAMGMGVEEAPSCFEYPESPLHPHSRSHRDYREHCEGPGKCFSSSSRSHLRASSRKSTPQVALVVPPCDEGFSSASPARVDQAATETWYKPQASNNLISSESEEGHESNEPEIGASQQIGPISHQRQASPRQSPRAQEDTLAHTSIRPCAQHRLFNQVRTEYESPLRYSTTGFWRGETSPRAKRIETSSHTGPGSRSQQSMRSQLSDEESEETHHHSRMSEDLILAQKQLYQPRLVYLASPFVMVSLNKRVEAGVYFAFAKLMDLLRPPAGPTLAEQLAVFHSLFRRTLPDLKTYFEEEDLDVTPFVATWLRSLFTGGGMKLDLRGHEGRGGVLRLWDSYFARIHVSENEPAEQETEGQETSQLLTDSTRLNRRPDMISHWTSSAPSQPNKIKSLQYGNDDANSATPYHSVMDREPHSLHLYVCLAVLLHCKDTLEELDRSECESFLRTLPELDVDKVLSEALNLRLSHKQAAAFSHARTPVLASLFFSSARVNREENGVKDDEEGGHINRAGTSGEELDTDAPDIGHESTEPSGGGSAGADYDDEDNDGTPHAPTLSTEFKSKGWGLNRLKVPPSLLPSEGDVDAFMQEAIFQ